MEDPRVFADCWQSLNGRMTFQRWINSSLNLLDRALPDAAYVLDRVASNLPLHPYAAQRQAWEIDNYTTVAYIDFAKNERETRLDGALYRAVFLVAAEGQLGVSWPVSAQRERNYRLTAGDSVRLALDVTHRVSAQSSPTGWFYALQEV